MSETLDDDKDYQIVTVSRRPSTNNHNVEPIMVVSNLNHNVVPLEVDTGAAAIFI